jgi:hypothetical protein
MFRESGSNKNILGKQVVVSFRILFDTFRSRIITLKISRRNHAEKHLALGKHTNAKLHGD